MMAQTTEDLTYHERVQNLLDGAKRFHEAVAKFAESSANVEESVAAQNNGLADIDIASLADNLAQQVEETNQNFEDVKTTSENASDLVSGINLDALLDGVNLNGLDL